MGRPEKPLPTPVTPPQILGWTVRDFRRAAGLTVTELADALGGNRSTLYSAEHGTRLPGEAYVVQLDATLNADGVIVALYEDVLSDKRESRMSKSRLRSSAATKSVAKSVEVAGDASGWVCDVTVPDGSVFRPLQEFVKTWRIRNEGTVPWHNRYLRRIGARTGYGVVSTPLLTPIPDAQPGEEIDVSVSCIAQVHEGSSVALFKMSDADRNLYFPTRYGVGLMLSITVVGD